MHVEIFESLQIVAKGIISRKGSGAIVNISSISSTLAFPGVPIYCTTKAAMDMLTKSMALEFGPLKIRVNSCNPGVVLTPMTEKFLVAQEQKDALTGRIPMGRFIEQDEVANTVVFLLSDYATMINGALVPVDGGHSIGRCIALKLSKLGAKVYAISRTEADLDSLKEEDSSIETRCLDIAYWDNTRKVIGDIGQVDLLVNNAGINKKKTVLEATEEFIDEHFDVNFKAALNISQIVAKGIISRKGSGAIVNISSLSSTLAFPGVPIYCTTKAAMDMLTKSMALEFGPFKVNYCDS
ncbi:Hypothetical predicted protein [Mytilus galloprovincialis]|uniref:Uncharacterized protein n=1 Tax=Mytilus galloprovincialis TaxID=29158 RepID=A0A8B6FFK3_MYTGA|nr:Hypothetical predicted protein [Mytilus galloprovincialis]